MCAPPPEVHPVSSLATSEVLLFESAAYIATGKSHIFNIYILGKVSMLLVVIEVFLFIDGTIFDT